jgi:adenylate cyclase
MKSYVELLEDALEQYVGPPVLRRIKEDPTNALQLSHEIAEVTLFFTDVRSFSQTSRRMSPSELASELNRYLATACEVLFKHDAYIDSLIGDEIFAVFGLSSAKHADDACGAALECMEAIAALNMLREVKVPFDVGIGINSGKALVGNIGSKRKLKYTAIGDSVNLGARMERLTAQYGCHIILTEYTKRLLSRDFTTRELDMVSVGGSEARLAIYSLEG